MSGDTYTHGHHESVVRSHAGRTAENSAAYLLPLLESGQTLLDVGCGPGTITLDLARRVAPGRVVGVDAVADVIAVAEENRQAAGIDTVEFRVDDAYALDVADDGVDVVHAHQVLQHLTDPVGALREMRRVVRPGGIVAVRDADYGGMFWAGGDDRIERWREVYCAVAKANDAEPDAARHLVGWAREAGFADIAPSVDSWLFATPDRVRWWGAQWAERTVASGLATQAMEYGIATDAELADLADGWRAWIEDPAAWFAVVNGQLICRG